MPNSDMMRLVTFVMVVALTVVTFVTPAWSQDSQAGGMGTTEGGTASGAGMQVAAGLCTIVYLPIKAAFAIGGGIVGGLTYLFTGGNENAAKSVWTTSMYGTYLITPEHLQGDRAIRFLGVADMADTPAPAEPPVQEPIR